ncbi:MAG TPA: AMP-binding protein [Candidatus Udaeobacter sp.]|nr:AMP-binding protein [Candidatus Udaeobacter sp.]
MTSDQILGRLRDLSSASPDRTAFVSAEGSLSFGRLHRTALELAAWLAKEGGVRPGDRVAIALPRSLEGVQAIYGVLAAGAVYVPIPVQGPAARVEAILASIAPRLLMTTADTARRLVAPGNGEVPVASIAIASEGQGLAPFLADAAGRLVTERRPEDVSAIFFTSGSTGQPKGVMMTYGGLGGMAGWIAQWARLSGDDRLMSDAGLHYATAFDLLTPVFSCCCTILLSDRETMFPERVAATMASQHATLWCSSATALRLLYERGQLERRDLRALRRVEFFGEPLSVAVLRCLMAILPKAEFVNFYGATEAHRIATYTVPRPMPEDFATLPIGRPTDNYLFSLRDPAGQTVQPGDIGEICVEGAKCLTGYWADAVMSAAKRVGGRPNSYRSGDLARFGKDGTLHLVGREDRMVKLRGHRFDLGEVEAVLKADPGVGEALAFAFANSRGDLEIRVAVGGLAANGLEARLDRLAAEKLPAYARPVRIAILTRLPQLSNGKIDREKIRTLLAEM